MGDNNRIGARKDPTWKYTKLANPPHTDKHICPFCAKHTSGGISRQKEHLIGTKRKRKNVSLCPAVPPEVKEELLQYEDQQVAIRHNQVMEDRIPDFDEYEDINELDTDEDEDIQLHEARQRQPTRGNCRGRATGSRGMMRTISSRGSSYVDRDSFASGAQSRKLKGPMDSFLTPDPAKEVEKDERTRKLRQTSIKEVDKDAVLKVHQDIARFWYEAGIAFNVANLKSFKVMLKSVGQFGPHLPPPTYHALRVPLLQKELQNTKKMLEGHEEVWASSGCSLMSDGWTDRKGRTLINFLVNSPRGTVFLESMDASDDIKSGDRMFQILDEQLQKIGPLNVVQVITDNASSLKMAGGMLEGKYPHLFWTPCAAHCINLMLKDIGELSIVKRTMSLAMQVTGYIYSHGYVLNMMREFTKKRELLRPAVTRFATSYLTLDSIFRQKANLRNMFRSTKWLESKWAADAKGKSIENIIFMPSFWNNIFYILKLTAPLVRVLRMVDGDKKPAMGYIYEAMDRAKEQIMTSFGGVQNEHKYKDAFKIIDRRWDVQLHRPLHAAAFLLNPSFYYDNKDLPDQEIMMGFLQVLKKLVDDRRIQDLVMDELPQYRDAEGIFGFDIAIRNRKKKSPAEWWKSYGASTPNLQKLAIRILGLTCSASGCERNWSTFENIHTKKRNRLDHKRLNDLVFIKYNRRMLERYNQKDVLDPIMLLDLDESNEWLIGEYGEGEENAENDLVFEDDDLTWGAFAEASGAEEPRRITRTTGTRATPIRGGRSTTRGGRGTSGSRGKAPIVEESEEEEEFDDYVSDAEEGAHIDFGSGGEDDNEWDEEDGEEDD